MYNIYFHFFFAVLWQVISTPPVNFEFRSATIPDTLNVKKFGVKGDGISDDTDSLDKVFNIPDGQRRMVIYFPPGIYMVRQGLLLQNNLDIVGNEEKSTIKLISGLPARKYEESQTAIFSVKGDYDLTSNIIARNISILNINIDCNRPGDPQVALLGGIRIINPVNCHIRHCEIHNPNAFGIWLAASNAANGICVNNDIEYCQIYLQKNWYVGFNAPNPQALQGIDLTSFGGGSNDLNGMNIFSGRSNDSLYLRSRANHNIIAHNYVEGGSHDIGLTNASDNIIYSNETFNGSHRGIILSTTSDSNVISFNYCHDQGSTGIHLCYGCDHNIIKHNLVVGTRGTEGDGIKIYVNCNYNIIDSNKIIDCPIDGIRVAHGAIGNQIFGDTIIYDKGEDTATYGIKVVANLSELYNLLGLKFNNDLKAKDNLVDDNLIIGTNVGILLSDELAFPKSIIHNTIKDNNFIRIQIPISFGKLSKKSIYQIENMNSVQSN